MQTILFLFALLTTPTDRWVCDLWTNQITRDGVISACGVDLLEGLRLDVYVYEDMRHVCSVDAVYLNDIAELAEICQLRMTLDNYVLRLNEPGYYSIICYVESTHEDAPVPEEIAAQCPQARNYVIEFAGTKTIEEEKEFQCPSRDLLPGYGLYQQAPSAQSLLTDEDYTWLAGQLIWGGLVRTNCDYPIDVNTMTATPCGMAAARSKVVQWQNQFDQDIYNVALAYNVPARLLKRMMGVESQFYPFYTGPDGEHGVMQITDNGLDTLLRFDRDIDPFYFERGDTGKFWSRSVTRDTLKCEGCTLKEAVEKIKKDLPIYARILAAFHCRAVTVNPALTGDLAWEQAVVDYNGSFDYLSKIEGW
ncbi:MAG: hypothetical protein HY865_01015 [Chloroflexi bacterium]|nr:hypothetical protein [Chloroflexota bacterium]